MLYAGEGESRKPDENATPPVMNTDAEKIQSTIVMKVQFLKHFVKKTIAALVAGLLKVLSLQSV